LAWALGGLAIVTVVVLVISAPANREDGAIDPSRPGEVTVTGDPRAQPFEPRDLAPSFTAPGFRVATGSEPPVTRQSVSWSPGEPTVLSIWAPWCPHCQVEMPVLARVSREFPDVAFVSVLTSIGDRPGPDPGTFMAERRFTMPTAIDDARGTLARAFGTSGFPTLYFVGADGIVAHVTEGEIEETALRELIDSLT
jgi:thiol-disulfide isomerase/thioredoxin